MSDNPVSVLLIEDNPADARLIRECLKEAKGGPFELQCVHHLSAGLELLATGRFDILILDLGLLRRTPVVPPNQ